MIVVAIDATTDRLSVAVGSPQGPIVAKEALGARRHAGLLGSLVDLALEESGLSVSRVDALAVADGPGSFTGLRVAAAWAKGLSRARSIPVWTASTLLVRARRGAAPGRLVAGVGSALRGEWYLALYRFEQDGAIVTVRHPMVVAPGIELPSASGIGAIVGDLPESELERFPGTPTVVIGPPEGWPQARFLIELIGRQGGAVPIDDLSHWEPNYGRPAEAQAKWEREHGGSIRDSLGINR